MTASPDPYKAPGIRQWELQDRHAQLCAMLLWLVVATAAQSTCPPAEDSHVIEYLVLGKREIRMSSYRNAWRFMVAYLHMPALHTYLGMYSNGSLRDWLQGWRQPDSGAAALWLINRVFYSSVPDKFGLLSIFLHRQLSRGGVHPRLPLAGPLAGSRVERGLGSHSPTLSRCPILKTADPKARERSGNERVPPPQIVIYPLCD